MSNTLSHIDEKGDSRMVDVGDKKQTRRVAIARCDVIFSPETLSLLEEKALPKGDALGTAKVAGILAAKQTSNLIPMCHPLFIEYLDVRFDVNTERSCVHVEAEARMTGKTGVEMEALTAAQVAALTLYDMCKAVQKDIVIDNCRLVYKSGGKSGTFDVR